MCRWKCAQFVSSRQTAEDGRDRIPSFYPSRRGKLIGRDLCVEKNISVTPTISKRGSHVDPERYAVLLIRVPGSGHGSGRCTENFRRSGWAGCIEESTCPVCRDERQPAVRKSCNFRSNEPLNGSRKSINGARQSGRRPTLRLLTCSAILGELLIFRLSRRLIRLCQLAPPEAVVNRLTGPAS